MEESNDIEENNKGTEETPDIEIESVELEEMNYSEYESCHAKKLNDIEPENCKSMVTNKKESNKNTKKVYETHQPDPKTILIFDVEIENETKNNTKMKTRSKKRKFGINNLNEVCEDSEACLRTDDTKTGRRRQSKRLKSKGTNIMNVKDEIKDIEEETINLGTSDTEREIVKHNTKRKKKGTSKKTKSGGSLLKYTCFTCNRHFLSESNLAEHIKWTHEFKLGIETEAAAVVDHQVKSKFVKESDLSDQEQVKSVKESDLSDQEQVKSVKESDLSDQEQVKSVKESDLSDQESYSSDQVKVKSTKENDETKIHPVREFSVELEKIDQPQKMKEALFQKNDLSSESVNSSKIDSIDTSPEKDKSSNVIQITNTDKHGIVDLYDNFSPDIICLESVKELTSSCPYCGKVFVSKKSIQSHTEMRCKKVPYRCFICKKGLSSPDQEHFHLTPNSKYKKNYYVKKADKNRAFSCPVCSEKFQYKVTLQNHQMLCKESSPLCTTSNKVACEVCGKEFSKTYIDNHMLLHNDEKGHICEYCGEGHHSRTRLHAHIQSMHVESKKFKCQYCDAEYTQKSALEYHQNVLIGKCKGDLSCKTFFKCTLCSRQFTSIRWLARHQDIHKKDESKGLIIGSDFACHICEKKFKERHLLLRHVKIHTKEKQFRCDQCDRAFIQKVNLIAHMKTHTGDRPYECEFCDKKFIQKSGLKTHLKKHTGGERKLTSHHDKVNVNKGKCRTLRKKVVDKECQTETTKKPVRTFDITPPIIFKVVTAGDSITLEQIPSKDIEIKPETYSNVAK